MKKSRGVTTFLVNLFLLSLAGWTILEGEASNVGRRNRDNQLDGESISALQHLSKRRRCVDYDHSRDGKTASPHEDNASVLEPEKEMICSKESQFCYAFWEFNEKNETKFLKQGCWESSSAKACLNSQCVAEVPRPKSSETTTSPNDEDEEANPDSPQPSSSVLSEKYFCCCDGDNCNMDVEILYVDEDPDSSEDVVLLEENHHSGRRSLWIILITSGSLLIGLFIIFTGYHHWKRVSLQYNKNGEAEGDGGEDGLSQGGMQEGKLLLLDGEEISVDERNIIDGIQLVVLLARGKFASVYEGKIPSLSDAPYALKCFTKDQKEFFENERYVFNHLGKHCNHENIIKYHGWQEFTVGPTTHLILVLDKICPGNLREYLQSVTGAGDQSQDENESLKVKDVLRICSGIASGLSYLHGENRDEIVIAHRDLTSKNILLDGETLTPKITDFGLSLVTKGSKYYWAGRERQAEFCSLAEAGTLRYMAPELLEGAVNLKDCENALKQADVYALALIIWEVANCSRDMRMTRAPPQQQSPSSQQNGGESNGTQDETSNNNAILPVQHCLPYEEEIGKESFSMDLLTRHVVQYRNRPNFRRWRDTPYTRQLRDTLIESWDAEPDARLTALCIVERLIDIRNIRVKNSDLPGTLSVNQQQQIQTPLESPGQNGMYDSAVIDSPWTGRNPCLQRNLLTVTASSTTGGHHGGMMSTSGSGMSESNSLLESHHPLLLHHYDFAKNQANLNFYHNYVGGSSGGTSYSSTSTTSASTGGNNTEMSNVSVTGDDARRNPLIETRFQNTGGSSAGAQSPNGAGGAPPLPPSIPFVQNLHA